MAYDRIGDRIFLGVGNELRILEGQSGQLQWQHAYGDSIDAVHVLYEE
jgi:hypothetical protein